MDYIHVKKLEKYHPGYRDRHLIWCKTYFTMIQADPDFEMLCELDKWRFVTFVMLELQIKKPFPADEAYLARKGLNFKNRPLTKTLSFLSHLIEITNVTQLSEERNDSVTHNRIEYIRIDKKKSAVTDQDFLTELKQNKAYDHINIDVELKKMDAWILVHPGRQKTKKFIVNWLNKIEKPFAVTKPVNDIDKQLKADREKHKKMVEEAAPMTEEQRKELKKMLGKIGGSNAPAK